MLMVGGFINPSLRNERNEAGRNNPERSPFSDGADYFLPRGVYAGRGESLRCYHDKSEVFKSVLMTVKRSFL